MMIERRRILLTAMIVNAFEMYNFVLFGIFSAFLLPFFFPPQDGLALNLSILGTFSAGFLARPLGAIIFGIIGDKFGRSPALCFAIFLGSISMLIIGCMPSYDTIGIFASFLIVLMRILQGISFGGSYNDGAIFVLEHMGHSKPSNFLGVVSGALGFSVTMGSFLAIIMGMLVLHFSNITWLWRLPFIFGAMIGLLGFYVRLTIDESPEYKSIDKFSREKISLTQIIFQYPKSSLCIFLLGGLIGSLPYASMSFFSLYLSRYLGFSFAQISGFYVYAVLTVLILSPLFGLLSDYFDRRGYFAMAVPSLLIMNSGIFELLQQKTYISCVIAHILMGVSFAIIIGPSHAFFQTLFPVEVRCRGIAVNYCLGSAILGGIAPMLSMYFIEKTGNLNSPVIFISFIVVLTLFSIINLGSVNYMQKKTDYNFKEIA